MLSVLTKDGYMPIENRQSYYIEMNYDGFSQLSFDVSNNDPMSKYLINEAVIKNEDNRFLIKDVNRRTQNTTYTCEIDLDEWKENIFFDTANDVRFQTKSLGEVLDVIKPNDWKIINASIRSIKRTPELKDATSYDILKSLEETYSIVFEIRVLSKEICIVDPEQFEYDGLYATSELNMKKVTWQGSSKDFCTRLYAYGKVDEDGNTINITSVNDGKEYIDDNTYTDKIVTLVWRDERYTEPQSLYDDARKKLDQLCVPKMSYDISIYDLSQMNKEYDFLQFGLYKQVKTFINDELSILQKVVTYKKYYDKPDKNVITLSNEQQKFTSKVSNALGGSSNQIINGSILEQAQKESAQIINEFATKGHKYETENETYFLDKLPKEAAKFVMRQNLGGIAFSQSGWAGPYTTAWTIDGKFNADFITTGTLKAIKIEGGSGDFSGKITSALGNIAGFELGKEGFTKSTVKHLPKAYTDADSNRVKDIIMGTVTPTEEDYRLYDTDGDGKITAADWYRIMYIYARINSSELYTDIIINCYPYDSQNIEAPAIIVKYRGGNGKIASQSIVSARKIMTEIFNAESIDTKNIISCNPDNASPGVSTNALGFISNGDYLSCKIYGGHYSDQDNIYVDAINGYLAFYSWSNAIYYNGGYVDDNWYAGSFFPGTGGVSLGKSSTSNRWFRLYANNASSESSDERLKTNIVEFDDRYVKLFEMLTPVMYNWKTNTESNKEAGLIAQRVQEAMKECGISDKEFGCVDYSDNEGYLGLIYRHFQILTMYYVKEKNKEVQTLKDSIDDLVGALKRKGVIE